MNRTHAPNPRSFSLATCLALAAVLWLNCVQATEQSHLHGWGGSYEQCLTCQTDGSGALDSRAAPAVAGRSTRLLAALSTQSSYEQYLSVHPARGPPQNT